MLKNYFKIALRNLWKNKGYSAINIIGLSMGIATCLLITLYVLDELSFDRYNKKADRIYRINADIKFGGDEQKLAVAPDPMAFTMVKDYPEVENAVRFRNYGPSLVKKRKRKYKRGKSYLRGFLFVRCLHPTHDRRQPQKSSCRAQLRCHY